MIQTVEMEMVKAQTRLDGVDARLKKIESKLDKMTWYIGVVCGFASVAGTQILKWMSA